MLFLRKKPHSKNRERRYGKMLHNFYLIHQLTGKFQQINQFTEILNMFDT